MAFYSNPKIVTDGLVLALDAGSENSYPGSGTTWTDLSGNGNTCTLTDITFDSDGYIVFDGDGSYGVIDNSNSTIFSDDTDFTIEIWANKDTNSSNTSAMMLHYRGRYGYPSLTQFAYGAGSLITDGGLEVLYDDDDDGDASTGGNIVTERGVDVSLTGEMIQFISTYSRVGTTHTIQLYNNTINVDGGDATSSHVWRKPTNPYADGIVIASSAHNIGNTSHGFEGKFAIVRVYNKALTQAEITQNFNSQRNRFGI